MSDNAQTSQEGQDGVWGLQSRDLVIDTNVFRTLGMNLSHPLLQTLQNAVKRFGLRLHVNDLLLAEYKARINEYAEAAIASTKRFRKELNPLRSLSPGLIEAPEIPEADDLTDRLYDDFLRGLTDNFGLVTHPLSELDAEEVLTRYIAQQAPFDRGGKEFPDAFILQMAKQAVGVGGEGVFLLTGDKALQRAAEGSPLVHVLTDLPAFLQIITGIDNPEAATWLGAARKSETFESSFREALVVALAQAATIYTSSDLIEPEAIITNIVDLEELRDFTPVSVIGSRINFVAKVVAHLFVEVSFLEEDVDHKARTINYVQYVEPVHSNDHDLRVFVSYDNDTETVARVELLNPPITIEESVEEQDYGEWD